MARVLTEGSFLLCAHAGVARSSAPAPRVRVAGQSALVQGPLLVSGCVNPPPPAGTGPCITAQFTTAAIRVRSMGLPLLVDSGLSVCAPTGTPLTAIALQPRVAAQ